MLNKVEFNLIANKQVDVGCSVMAWGSVMKHRRNVDQGSRLRGVLPPLWNSHPLSFKAMGCHFENPKVQFIAVHKS